jgi:hypothetical protein
MVANLHENLRLLPIEMIFTYLATVLSDSDKMTGVKSARSFPRI